MKNIALRYIHGNGYVSKKGTQPLYVEVRIVGTNQKKLFPTGIKLEPNQFSDKNGFTCVKHDKATMVTVKAREVYTQIEAFAYSDKCNSLDDIANYKKEDVFDYSPIAFIKERLSKKNASFAVVEQTNSFIKRLEEFGRFKTFEDVTYINLLDFDGFLRKHIKSAPTLYKRHIMFKSYIRLAIHSGLCKKNPYDEFDNKKGKSKDPIFLTETEVERIKNFTPGNEKLQHVKDLFLVQCYTGMAYVDVMDFSKSKIMEIDGRKILSSSRTKTDESYISLLLPEAEEIIERYRYQLPKISNQKYNDYLKLLATGADITKNLTSHSGRHTYATYLLNRGVPIETVSRTLGHSNLKQSQHYARMLGKKVIDDMEKMINGRTSQPDRSNKTNL